MKDLQNQNSALIIELTKIVAIAVNSTLTLVFWQVGNKINDFVHHRFPRSHVGMHTGYKTCIIQEK